MKTPVIVLDGNQRAALAVVRSLGAKAIPVIVGESIPDSISAVSKFSQDNFVYHSPYEDPSAFIGEIVYQCSCFPKVLLFPITDVALGEILKNRNRFPENVIIPFPSWEVYREASDKVSLFRRAIQLAVPVPATLFSDDFDSSEDLISKCSELLYPLVVKPEFSRILKDGKWLNAGVRYARNREELQGILHDLSSLPISFMIQGKIDGPGIGVFLLMDNGQVVAKFSHMRLREKPPSGGVSVLSESIEIPETALHAAVKLLEGYNWSGVAMVEFKLDRFTGIPKLMEINARFWGSLQLAISSGVDFPYLLYAHAMGDQLSPVTGYRIGVKSRWELGDLDHLLIRLRRKDSELNLPADAPSKFALIKEYFLDYFRPAVRHEVFRLQDPRPFYSELRQYICNLVG